MNILEANCAKFALGSDKQRKEALDALVVQCAAMTPTVLLLRHVDLLDAASALPQQVCCSMLQCVVVYCSVLLCVAVCCSVLQCDIV